GDRSAVHGRTGRRADRPHHAAESVGTENLMTLPVVLTLAALLVVTTLALLWSRWPVWAKSLLVVGVTAFYFFAFEAVSDMWGWPAAEALPERFVLLAAVIEEPTKQSPGALYVWVNSLDGGHPAQQPRAFRLPYEKDLHALLNEGLKKARQGVTQMGTAQPRAGNGRTGWLRSGTETQDIKIRDLPAPQLPEK